MSSWGFFARVFLFVLATDGVISSVVVKKGEDAIVTCSAPDTGGLYQWIKPGAAIISPSFTYDENKYGLDGTKLIVKNVDFTDGGRYNCYLIGGDGNPSGTELIVLGETDLTLPLNAKDTGVNSVSTNISCKAHYSSSFLTDLDIDDEPAMEILMTGVDLRPQEGMTEDKGPGDKSTYAMYASYKPDEDDDDKTVTCKFYFASRESIYDENKETIGVRFPLTEITIVTPEPLEGYTKTYTVGQKLNCTAQGNPNPTFNWRRESSTMAQILSAVLTLDNNMMGANNWICEAQQFGSGVDNKKVARISFDVKPAGTDPGTDPDASEDDGGSSGDDKTKIIVGVLVPLILIVIIVIIIIICCRLRKNKAERDTAYPPVGVEKGPNPVGNEVHALPDPSYRSPKDGVQPGYPAYTGPGAPPSAGRDSPGYGDLGVKHINGSYPSVNPNISFDESYDERPPRAEEHPPPGYTNLVYSPSPKGSQHELTEAPATEGGTAV